MKPAHPWDDSGASGESSEPADRADASTSDSGGMGWLWPAIGLLVVIAAAAGLFVFMRGRREPTGRSEPSLGDDDAAAAARAAVARDPGDLGAHLSLLRVLADEGREEEFTDAFDQMYQEVDDESAPEWQEALTLAAAHVPDHPLLTPRETSTDGPEDELDRRADEMFGMLDTDDSDDSDTDPGSAPTDDDTFDLDVGDEDESGDDDERRDDGRDDGRDKRQSSESLGEDMDLAVLSERLDDPAGRPEGDDSQDDEGDSADFDKFEEIDEYSPEAYATDDDDDDESEAPVSIDEDKADGPDLDFAPSREQEADEVFGESGARDSEELDLEFSSDADEADSGHTDDGLDFELDDLEDDALEDDSDAPESVPGAGGASGGSAGQASDEADAEEAEEAPLAGGSLSDEDADVKLDLARAYISVDLSDSARTVLEEVISDGSEEKRAEAQKLLDSIV